MTNLHITTLDDGWLIAAPDLSLTPQKDWFDPQVWQQLESIEGTSTGRYTTWFIHEPQTQAHWVLRHYWRGGLVAKFIKDSYWFTGVEQTRAVAELKLLNLLHGEGFAVPKPVAAHIEKNGLFYRADILIERIEHSQDLVGFLSAQALSGSQWQQLGACLAKFHQRGVYHADLNAKNILFAQDQFYLIDFDRGELRTPNTQWQQANLARLQRSFLKEQGKQPALQFSDANWQQLLLGYQQQLAH